MCLCAYVHYKSHVLLRGTHVDNYVQGSDTAPAMKGWMDGWMGGDGTDLKTLGTYG